MPEAAGISDGAVPVLELKQFEKPPFLEFGETTVGAAKKTGTGVKLRNIEEDDAISFRMLIPKFLKTSKLNGTIE